MNINSSQSQKILAEFFKPEYRISYDWDLLGSSIRDGKLYLGGYLRGPKPEPWIYLSHEMAHFVEIDEARCLDFNYGLKVPRQWVYNDYVCEPVTMQITARELRVSAFQSNFLEAIGVRYTIDELVSSLQYLPDYYMVPGKTDKQKHGFRVQRCLELKAKFEYSFQNFCYFWHQRAKI